MDNHSHRLNSYAGRRSKSQVSARFIIILILPLVLIGMAYIAHASPLTPFSTYVIGSANYTLTFNNLSSTTLYVNPNVNASYILNVTNYGNTTETYNMSVNGTGSLNVTQITLNPDESTIIHLNVSNSTGGTYYSNVTGILSTNSSIIMNSFEDIGQIVTIVDNTAPNQPQLNSPQNGATNQNLTVTLNTTTPETGDAILVTVNATDNIGVINVTANGVGLTQNGNIWNRTIIAIEGTHSVNVSAVDAAGNTGWDNSTR